AYVPAKFKYTLLPSTHYTLPANLEVMIKSGTNVGSVPCVFKMDMIMKDSLAFTKTYILPFIITSSSADSILKSIPSNSKVAGDKAFIVIKFVDKREGNYNVKGKLTEIDTLTNAPIGTPVTYRKESLNENVRTLTTLRNNLLELNGLANVVAGSSSDQTNRSYIEFIGNAFTYKTYKNSTLKISNSTVSYVEKSASDKYFVLNYDYVNARKKYKVSDTLVFRDFRNTAVLEW
ncbi:MAG: DUF1735 domain-containing protein, partial [Pseudarcicella sp.]|nr:DUF1735 domain-containing protein [Pseudarcicella sp.]